MAFHPLPKSAMAVTPLCLQKSLPSAFSLHEHRLAVEEYLPVGIIDLAGEEREVNDGFKRAHGVSLHCDFGDGREAGFRGRAIHWGLRGERRGQNGRRPPRPPKGSAEGRANDP